jgi:hypothetical protein
MFYLQGYSLSSNGRSCQDIDECSEGQTPCRGSDQGPFSRHFIFYITYKYARVLHYNSLERLAGDEHSSFVGLIVSYEENEVL